MLFGEKVLSYVTRVKQSAVTLKFMSVETDDRGMAMVALNGLSPNFESFIVAFDALGNSDRLFTFRSIESTLLQEEHRSERCNHRAERSHDSSALVSGTPSVAQSRPAGQGPGTRRQKAPEYKSSNCGRDGNTVGYCWGRDVSRFRPPALSGFRSN